MAQEYIQSGKVVVINNRIHLPDRQPIPNNIFGRNLQAKIDAWISGTVVATSTHRPKASFTHNTPPHAVHCIEILERSYGQAVQQAHIVEI